MKVYLSADMEGTAGVVDWAQCLPGEREYEHYRRLLLGEVNAAIDGAADAGAREFPTPGRSRRCSSTRRWPASPV